MTPDNGICALVKKRRKYAIDEGLLGRQKGIRELLKRPNLSINQQDCNGFTALIKCAVQRYNRKKSGNKYNYYEELYKMLLDNGADTRIRDRNNRTAEDWWNMADHINERNNADD